MKRVAVLLLSVAALASAAQHQHQRHHHVAKRDPTPVEVISVPGPTVIVYELNGRFINEDEVREGLANGTLVLAQNGKLSSAPSSTSVAPETQAAYVAPPPPSPTSEYVAPVTTSESTPEAAPTTTSSSSEYVAPATTSSSSEYVAPSPSPSAPAPPTNKGGNNNGPSVGSSSGSGVDQDFPDGSLDCSHFPSDYGAVDVHWMGLGGWTGVQTPENTAAGFANILTAIHGGGCTEGSYCSYACPAGYQKAQWPTTQGATGQSVGGILCQGGKLHLTNTAMSSKLCMPGTSKVDVQVQNKLSSNAAVCRTDYPGTEGETVPLDTQPGQSYPLTCPDADRYYNWKGGKTSAQYYVNPAGVSVSDACQWGSPGSPWGNYAPLNLGVGYSGGRAWLSIFQNAPTTDAKLDFSVEIVGDNVSGKCKYSNGQYCGDAGCSSSTGCTVSVASGTATFVFS
ncbi:Sperm-associated antigen 4 protein [Oleoguttula sp. CCFEE 5521]